MEIKLKRMREHAKVPTYGTKYASCADLYAVDDVVIKPGEAKFVYCGWAMEIPEGHYMDIYPRGSMIAKQQLLPLVSPIDSDYRGEIYSAMKNIGNKDVVIRRGDRYAQMLIKKHVFMIFSEVDELTPTERGSGRFGSTGK